MSSAMPGTQRCSDIVVIQAMAGVDLQPDAPAVFDRLADALELACCSSPAVSA